MKFKVETIVAISTAPGIGGIGIIRMSGKNCFEILNKIFKPKNDSAPNGYTIKYGHIVENNNIIDEVLVSFFKEPSSYTTENMCEINCHGGIYALKKILELCIKNGARMAEPGEFTKKAFLNGRIDLIQAESVIDIINSKTKKEAEASINQLEGYLSNKIKKIRNKIMNIVINMEVNIDYPEYDVEELTKNETIKSLEGIKKELQELKNSFSTGKIIKEGLKVALLGRPNAGKSSLLNAILKEERAIVTDIEGTTRDTIEESVNLSGIPIHIIDTAGIRNATNEVEKIGIDKSRRIAEQADLIIAIFDCTKSLDNEDIEILNLIKDKKYIIVLNKIDVNERVLNISNFAEYSNIVELSAKEYLGIEELYNKIRELFELNEVKFEDSEIITNLRHKNAIDKATEKIKKAEETILCGIPIDIISVDLKEAMEELAKITGENVSADIINEIFAKFCLGK